MYRHTLMHSYVQTQTHKMLPSFSSTVRDSLIIVKNYCVPSFLQYMSLSCPNEKQLGLNWIWFLWSTWPMTFLLGLLVIILVCIFTYVSQHACPPHPRALEPLVVPHFLILQRVRPTLASGLTERLSASVSVTICNQISLNWKQSIKPFWYDTSKQKNISLYCYWYIADGVWNVTST